jgi:hypothetical protein
VTKVGIELALGVVSVYKTMLIGESDEVCELSFDIIKCLMYDVELPTLYYFEYRSVNFRVRKLFDPGKIQIVWRIFHF